MTTKAYIEKAKRSKVWYGWHILEFGRRMDLHWPSATHRRRKVAVGEPIQCRGKRAVMCCDNGMHGCFEIHEAWSWRSHGQCLTFCRFEADTYKDKDFDSTKFAARRRIVLWASSKTMSDYLPGLSYAEKYLLRETWETGEEVAHNRKLLRNNVIAQMKADGFRVDRYAFFKAQER